MGQLRTQNEQQGEGEGSLRQRQNFFVRKQKPPGEGSLSKMFNPRLRLGASPAVSACSGSDILRARLFRVVLCCFMVPLLL